MHKIIMFIVSIAISAIIGFVIGYKIKPEKIKVKKVYETKTQYIVVPKTTKELEECYKSPLKIHVATQEDKILIRAEDKCKSKDAVYKVEAKTHNVIYYFITGLLCGAVIILAL